MKNFAHKYENVGEMNKAEFAETGSRKRKYLGSSIVTKYFNSIV